MAKYEPKKDTECPVCGKMHDGIPDVVCTFCSEQGWWIDPAGGTLQDDPNEEVFNDPAKMYE